MSQKSFESAMQHLEKIVAQLETGDLSLEESIKVYEEGIKLMAYCNSKLAGAEQKIQLLQKDGDQFLLVPSKLKPEA